MRMSIQWYPGHMAKARRAIAEALPSKDVVLEVLDARMPRASSNPVVSELRGNKPCLKILSKSDLADPKVTEAWLRFFEADESQGKVLAIALTTTKAGEARRIPALCKQLAPHRISAPTAASALSYKVVRAMVVGIPNVGKSTLINALMERKVAKVGDEPAVTKSQQLVTLKDGMTLSDNPGILWPTIEDSQATLRLALGGAIPDTAMDYEVVGLFAARFFAERYPSLLMARYKLDTLPSGPHEILEAIGRRRGCLLRGGVVDMHKASDALVHDFRSGALGRISLEGPLPGGETSGAFPPAPPL